MPWYDFTVVAPVPPVVHRFVVPVDLWSLYPLAASLLTAGAVVYTLLLALSSHRAAGIAELAIGVAAIVYCLVRIFDIPALAAANAATVLDGTPFLALIGACLLALGSFALLAPGDEETSARPAAPRAQPA
jgi:predicted phage tail protein